MSKLLAPVVGPSARGARWLGPASVALGLGLAVTTTWLAHSTEAGKTTSAEAPGNAPGDAPGVEIPGAFTAMQTWNASRAYPAADIPRGAWAKAYEYSKAKFQAQVGGSPRAPLALDSDWESIGPRNGGGRTLTIAVDPLDPNTIWAGAASGGLWRSTTGGLGAAAWSRIDTGHPVLGVSTIAFEPGNPSVMYIGTGEVYNHGNAGDLAADRATRGSYGIGILKSTDGGSTWSKSLDWFYDERRGVWAVRVDSNNPSIVWAATTEGVYRSADAGATWSQSLGVLMATDLVVNPANSNQVLAACGNLSSTGRGIYRTTNGGTSWGKVTGGGIPNDFAGKIQFGVTPTNPNLVFASVGNGFTSSQGATWLLRSTNFGQSFSLRSTTDYSRYQGWFAHDVAINPLDDNHLICVGVDAWKSTNGGSTLDRKSSWWKFYDGDLPDGGPEGPSDYSHADHHDVLFHPTISGLVYLANDGGVFRSTDGGETFEGANGGYQSTQFYNGSSHDPRNPNLAAGGLQDNATAIFLGDGHWWRGALGGDGGWAAIDPSNNDRIYATYQNLGVGRSENGGSSFSFISPPDLGGPSAFISPLILSPTNPAVVYGGRSQLFVSTDRGDNWSVGNGGNTIDGNPILLLAAAPTNGDVLYLATAPFAGRGTVQRSLDRGATFADVTGTLPDRYPGDLAVHPSDESTVYLTLSGFGSSHVFRSTDYGASWTDIDGGVLPDVPTTAVVLDPYEPDHVYVGNDLGVYATADAGATWIQLAGGLSEAVLVSELGVSAFDHKLRAFTHGQGAFERSLLGTQGTGSVTPPKQY